MKGTVVYYDDSSDTCDFCNAKVDARGEAVVITFKERVVRTAIAASMYLMFLPIEYGGRVFAKIFNQEAAVIKKGDNHE
jgi:hypothetical protein